MRRLLLDTSFLVSAAQFRIDLESELHRVFDEPFSIVCSEKTVGELSGIAQGASSSAAHARVALKMLEALKPELVASREPVDDWLVHSSKPGDVVATCDRELRKRLAKGVRALVIKEKSKLGFA